MANEYVEDGVPFLRSQDVLPFRINTANLKQISPAFHRRITKSRLQPGDVVIVRTGYPGTASVIPRALADANCADLVIVRPSADLDAYFAACLFNSQAGKAAVAGRLVGAAQQHFNVGAAKAMEIALPPIDEQRRITSILSAYDDLIEVNRRRIAILEEMARRLFEEWFVHLRFPGHEGVPVHGTADGPLPEGWECRPLGQLVTEERDTVLPADLDGATMYVGLEHIPRRSTTLAEWGRAEDVVSAKLRFRRGDILFGKIRPYFHKVAIAPAHGVSSTDAIVLRSRSPRHAGIVAAIAASDAFVAHAVQTSNGTKMPRANWTILARYPVHLPPDPLLDHFNSFVVDGINHAILLAAANTRLAAARDLLLPRLVSGELSVAGAPMPDRLLDAAD